MVRVLGSKLIIKDSDNDDFFFFFGVFFYNQWKVISQYNAERFYFVYNCNTASHDSVDEQRRVI